MKRLPALIAASLLAVFLFAPASATFADDEVPVPVVCPTDDPYAVPVDCPVDDPPVDDPPVDDPPVDDPPVDDPPVDDPPVDDPPVDDPPVDDPPAKVFVCKYTGQPGVDEVLSHIISVNASSLEGTGFAGIFPFEFSDAHRSVAIAFDIGQDEPPLTDCPPADNPPDPDPEPTAYAALTVLPPTCLSPTSVVWTGALLNVIVGLLDLTPGTHTVTATAAPGFVFADLLAEHEFEYTIEPQLSGPILCPVTVPPDDDPPVVTPPGGTPPGNLAQTGTSPLLPLMAGGGALALGALLAGLGHTFRRRPAHRAD
jgi:hypothetical protein